MSCTRNKEFSMRRSFSASNNALRPGAGKTLPKRIGYATSSWSKEFILKTRNRLHAGKEFADPALPSVRQPLPGPKAQQIITEDMTYVSPSYTRGYPLVVESGAG